MIRIQKSPTPPEGFADKARAEAQRLCDLYDAGQRSFGKDDFKASIYQSTKSELLTQQHRKCCFCEANATTNQRGEGDVEHYRPKGECKQSKEDTTPTKGYYWLAYDWDNLFYACQTCNETYKKTLFPLANPQDRAQSHFDDISREEPMLLHPAHDEPEEHIFFEVTAFDDIDSYIPKGKTLRGKATIEICGLERFTLYEDRRDTLQDLISLMQAAQDDMPFSASARKELLRIKERRCSPTQQFSSLVQALFAFLPPSMFDDIS
jgi:uncharacterized protein (TIGR02646 family)